MQTCVARIFLISSHRRADGSRPAQILILFRTHPSSPNDAMEYANLNKPCHFLASLDVTHHSAFNVIAIKSKCYFPTSTEVTRKTLGDFRRSWWRVTSIPLGFIDELCEGRWRQSRKMDSCGGTLRFIIIICRKRKTSNSFATLFKKQSSCINVFLNL